MRTEKPAWGPAFFCSSFRHTPESRKPALYYGYARSATFTAKKKVN